MRIFEEGRLEITDDGGYIVLDNYGYNVVIGKHAVWIPDLEVKIIWSHCGRIESFKDWQKGQNAESIIDGSFAPRDGWVEESLLSVVNEREIMLRLFQHGAAPPVGELVYIKQFISCYPYGVEFCDVRGRYGYEVGDAMKLTDGKFRKGVMKKVFGEELEMSKGAIGDLYKGDNTVNGYLVDIRRTLWDMMHLKTDYPRSPEVKYDIDAIKRKVEELGQFPFRERKKPYQTYYLDGMYIEGSRNTVQRFEFMEVEYHSGDNVLDLGCSTGAMATEAYMNGAKKVLGIDSQKEYIECARDIAMVNSFPINYVVGNLEKVDQTVDYINKFFCGRVVDLVFALSLFKHVKFKIFDVLRSFEWRVCYIESNNAEQGLGTDHVLQMVKGIERLRDIGLMEVHYMGQTYDRSPRCVWRLERNLG